MSCCLILRTVKLIYYENYYYCYWCYPKVIQWYIYTHTQLNWTQTWKQNLISVTMQLICDPMNLKPRKVRRSGGGGDSSAWVGRSAPARCPAVPAAPPCSGRRRKRCRLLNETFVPLLKLHLWFLRHCFFFFPKMFFFPLSSQWKVCPQLVGRRLADTCGINI